MISVCIIRNTLILLEVWIKKRTPSTTRAKQKIALPRPRRSGSQFAAPTNTPAYVQSPKVPHLTRFSGSSSGTFPATPYLNMQTQDYRDLSQIAKPPQTGNTEVFGQISTQPVGSPHIQPDSINQYPYTGLPYTGYYPTPSPAFSGHYVESETFSPQEGQSFVYPQPQQQPTFSTIADALSEATATVHDYGNYNNTRSFTTDRTPSVASNHSVADSLFGEIVTSVHIDTPPLKDDMSAIDYSCKMTSLECFGNELATLQQAGLSHEYQTMDQPGYPLDFADYMKGH